MKLDDLLQSLRDAGPAEILWTLPDGRRVPPHAHVTEVARIDKRFIDCGGTLRSESVWRLQTWIAEDFEHRLTAAKLARIITKATDTLGSDNLEIDVEHEDGLISQYPITSAGVSGLKLVIQLAARHTDCLARELCCPPQPPKKNLLTHPLPTPS